MKVQLSISAKDLPNVADAFEGTSDPFATVTRVALGEGGDPIVLGKTETIKNTLDPEFVKVILMEYELGENFHFVVGLYDDNDNCKYESMGGAMFEVGDILGRQGNVMAKTAGKRGGTIFCRMEKYTPGGTLQLKLRALGLTNREGMWRKSDPFFEVQKKNPQEDDGIKWVTLYRSNVVKDDLSPRWQEAHLDLAPFGGQYKKAPLRLTVWDNESSGDHVHMGSLYTTIAELMEAVGESTIDSSNALELKRRGEKTGDIVVVTANVYGLPEEEEEEEAAEEEAEEEEAAAEEEEEDDDDAPPTDENLYKLEQPTFVDYVAGGCELNVCMAIDFTGSNGDPREEGTLHYLGGDDYNDYQASIVSLASILTKYDSNKKVPVWGFGAKYDGEVKHCFQCGDEPEVQGVEGILQAYRDVFSSGLIMSRPTDATEVIRSAADHAVAALEAAGERDGQVYTILVILTDGSVSDVESHAQTLDEVSEAPLSIVIVGVGEDDFEDMQFLDERKQAGEARDICQFVKFGDFVDNRAGFTAATLNEIPQQLVTYFTERDIWPKRPKRRNNQDVEVEGGDDDEEEEINLQLEFGDEEEIRVVPPE